MEPRECDLVLPVVGVEVADHALTRDHRREILGGDRDRIPAPPEPGAKRHRELAARATDHDVGGQRALDAVGEVTVERRRQHEHATEGERRVDDRGHRPHHQAIADLRDRDTARPRAPRDHEGIVGHHSGIDEARLGAAERVIEHQRAVRIEHLEPGRRHVGFLARDPTLEPRAALRHRLREPRAIGELDGLVAEPLDGAQHEVEPDGELPLCVVPQAGLEVAEDHAGREQRDHEHGEQRRDRHRDHQLRTHPQPQLARTRRRLDEARQLARGQPKPRLREVVVGHRTSERMIAA